MMTLRTPANGWLRLAALMICFNSALLADGPVDNNPDTVRPVPKVGIEVPDADRQELEAGLAKLGALLERLKPAGEPIPDDPAYRARQLYADVAIFHRAVRVALDDQEFFDPKEIDAAKKLLAVGLERAEQLKQGETPWLKKPGLVVRGYISHIDHTPQPYGLIIPETYDFSISSETPKPVTKGKRHRMDVWFHGRGEVLSELNFITQRMTSVGPISPADTIVLHPYGRYCNANKFAGEIDTVEAISAAGHTYRIDPALISSRGFSMGGAAAWQFAVHYPNRWFAATPGAGFSETPEFLKFFQKETLNASWYEEKLWRWYDCPGYVENLLNLPVVAYSGEDDIQKQAADLMEAAYEKAGMKLPHIIAPKTGHSITPEAAKEIEGMLQQWAMPRDERSKVDRIDFVTYSLIYDDFNGGRILGLKEHWEPAHLSATTNAAGNLVVTTSNITAFSLKPMSMRPAIAALSSGIVIDDQPLKVDLFPMSASPDDLIGGYRVVDDKWQAVKMRDLSSVTAGKKNRFTCGPIDHAFMSSFIFVKPSGQCAHPEVQQWVDAEMNRAITQWRRQFRGDARVKLDTEITDDDIQTANLVLWGDSKSNALIGKLAGKLPIQWNDAEITVGEQKFDAPHHALIAISPNPENPHKYIVLNSGFTYREYDYLNNARQTAKLPDWAVVDLRMPPNSRWPGKIVAADFFDESWQLKPPRK